MSRFACDPNLTGNLNAEYEALQNDLEQAKHLARDYQNQLNDKSNDLAVLKQTLEHTAAHLAKLQENIVALRHERHNLANEVMKVVALEAKLASSQSRLAIAEARITSLTEDLKRATSGRREFIDMGLGDDFKSLEVLPTPVPPKPFRSGTR